MAEGHLLPEGERVPRAAPGPTNAGEGRGVPFPPLQAVSSSDEVRLSLHAKSFALFQRFS